FVVLWSVTEGALRQAGRRRDLEGDPDPRRLIRRLTSYGAITEAELRMLDGCFNIRSRVVHGFESDNLDERLISQLLSFTRRLLEAGETVHDAFDFHAVSIWVNSNL